MMPMTIEQLEALMNWVEAQIYYRQNDGEHGQREEREARDNLYDAFGLKRY